MVNSMNTLSISLSGPIGIVTAYSSFMNSSPGMIGTSGRMWKDHRRFSINMMRDFGMGKVGGEEKIQYENEMVIERFKSHRGRAFNPLIGMNMAVSNIICTMAFGKRFDYKDAEFKNVLDSINQAFRTLSHPALLYIMVSRFGKYIVPGHFKMFQMMYDIQLAFVRKSI